MTAIHHARMIALLGLPNAGKSTLLNKLTGRGEAAKKLSIVTHKAQTTRMIIHGVAAHCGSHLVFADTPGLFAPKISRALYQAAGQAAQEADMLLLISDAAKFAPEIYPQIITRLKEWDKPFAIALNKIDIAPEEKVFAQAAFWQDQLNNTDLFMISARRGTGLERLQDHLVASVKTTRTIQTRAITRDVLAAEITREKILLYIHEELPWQAEVKTISIDKAKEKAKSDLRITQEILLPHERQKPIFIGKGGQKLKIIGTKAREDMQKLFGVKVHLFLDVRLKP